MINPYYGRSDQMMLHFRRLAITRNVSNRPKFRYEKIRIGKVMMLWIGPLWFGWQPVGGRWAR